jgi:hypothetical protein
VRAQALEYWREQRRREDNAKYLAGLLKKYDVTVDERVTALIGPLPRRLAAVGEDSGVRE